MVTSNDSHYPDSDAFSTGSPGEKETTPTRQNWLTIKLTEQELNSLRAHAKARNISPEQLAREYFQLGVAKSRTSPNIATATKKVLGEQKEAIRRLGE